MNANFLAALARNPNAVPGKLGIPGVHKKRGGSRSRSRSRSKSARKNKKPEIVEQVEEVKKPVQTGPAQEVFKVIHGHEEPKPERGAALVPMDSFEMQRDAYMADEER